MLGTACIATLPPFLGLDEAVSALEYAMVVGIITLAVFAGNYKAPITAVAGKVCAITTPAIKVTP